MPHRTLPAATALTLLTLAAAAAHRHRAVHRALTAEKTARRLTDAAWHRDLQAFEDRLHALLTQQQHTAGVLHEADQVLDTALAVHRHNPQEGGPT
ncbi:hypothetical protein ABZ383_32075 [Streptomyces sp. NPDC005900]|uniref:hypothetical protein n=1 Tax=Streptomyces sp. NPDC005900 TaxID=3154569 RepID=UPI0034065403